MDPVPGSTNGNAPVSEQQELRRLLEETLAVSKDNQRMLHAMRREAWFNFFAKIVFWAIVIGLPIYLYMVYVQPVMSKIQSFLPGPVATTTTSGPFGFPTPTEVQTWFDQLKAKQ